jgi:hypothetical protein
MEFEMTKLSVLAVSAAIGLAGLAAPALAAPSAADTVPYCSTGNSQELLGKQMDNLAAQLQLNTKPDSSIEIWNGCIKVMSTTGGKTTVAFYDPDSLRLVDTLGTGALTTDLAG